MELFKELFATFGPYGAIAAVILFLWWRREFYTKGEHHDALKAKDDLIAELRRNIQERDERFEDERDQKLKWQNLLLRSIPILEKTAEGLHEALLMPPPREGPQHGS